MEIPLSSLCSLIYIYYISIVPFTNRKKNIKTIEKQINNFQNHNEQVTNILFF